MTRKEQLEQILTREALPGVTLGELADAVIPMSGALIPVRPALEDPPKLLYATGMVVLTPPEEGSVGLIYGTPYIKLALLNEKHMKQIYPALESKQAALIGLLQASFCAHLGDKWYDMAVTERIHFLDDTYITEGYSALLVTWVEKHWWNYLGAYWAYVMIFGRSNHGFVNGWMDALMNKVQEGLPRQISGSKISAFPFLWLCFSAFRFHAICRTMDLMHTTGELQPAISTVYALPGVGASLPIICGVLIWSLPPESPLRQGNIGEELGTLRRMGRKAAKDRFCAHPHTGVGITQLHCPQFFLMTHIPAIRQLYLAYIDAHGELEGREKAQFSKVLYRLIEFCNLALPDFPYVA